MLEKFVLNARRKRSEASDFTLPFAVTIKRQGNRRRASLQIKQGEVWLLLPAKQAIQELLPWLHSQQQWVERQLAIQPVIDWQRYWLFGQTYDAHALNKTKVHARLKLHQQHLIDRCQYLAELHGFSVSGVSVRQFSRRWGSCDQHRHIKLNIWLLGAPLSVIDSVILHELCHLTHLNHSSAFWQLLASHDAQWQQNKQWLAEHQQELLKWVMKSE